MKDLYNAIGQLFTGGFRYWKTASLVYVLQTLLALVFGAQVYQVLESSIGQSLSLQQLQLGYDHAVWGDFLKVHGASITPLVGQLRWLLLLYFLFSVFIEAGAMFEVKQEDFSVENKLNFWIGFWVGGSLYFKRLFLMSILFLIIIVLVLGVLWLPVMSHLDGWLQDAPSEVPIVWGVLSLVILSILFLMSIYAWSLKSKLLLVRLNITIILSMRLGWQAFWQHPFKRLSLVGAYIVISILMIWFATKVEVMVAPLTATTVWLVILAQQMMAWLRMILRMGLYSVWGAEINRQ